MISHSNLDELLDRAADQCRLCHGSVERLFPLAILNRHQVWYSRCKECGSLQTENPYWLADAYAHSLAASDVGAADRCLTCRAAVWVVLRLMRMKRVRLLDFGGGSGLLCRLMRDVGIDAWTCDPFRGGEYALSFRVDDPGAIVPGTFNVITAFEVMEHLANPHDELANLFKLSPDVLITSTDPYLPGYDTNWWYLSPETGQHLFFYSPRALQMIANRFNYALISCGYRQVFTRQPINKFTRKLARWLLRGKSLSISRVIIEALPNQAHINRDYGVNVKSKVRN